MREDTAELAARLAGMPIVMRETPQWLLWRFETYEGDTKPRKVPYYVNGHKRKGKQGDAQDRAALATLGQAIEALSTGRWDGVGFAFLPGDGLIGIDIDGAINPETGEVSERCRQIIEAAGSYTEFSPSGKGVHIIAMGETVTFKDNRIGVEVFCGRQFFTCTGRAWPGAPSNVKPLPADTLERLKALVERSKAAARPSAAPRGEVKPAVEGEPPEAPSDFKRVNTMAMAMLDAWVPALFPTARRVEQGYRVKQADLPGRSGLQEDLSITRDGIVDFGVHDMGDAQQGRRTPIDLVTEWRGVSPLDAMEWLARLVGVMLNKAVKAAQKPSTAQAGSRGKSKPKASPEPAGGEASEAASTPEPGSAEGPQAPGKRPDWVKPLALTDTGGIKDCRENVFHILTGHPELKGLVAFDEFAYRILKMKEPPWPSTPGEWTNNDDFELGLWLSQHVRLNVRSEAVLVQGVGMAAWRARFHPVKQYLGGLEWDGVDRLKHWLHECLGAEDTQYHSMVGTWFILGMVNRILNPGCQMDNMICLEGMQGEGKSTTLRILAGQWFADTPVKIGDKDAMLALAGIWLYEIAEMDSFNRAEVTAVKQYVTSREDRVREPYTRRHVTRPRSCVLGGTTNQDQYLKDSTGARRFWPVAVGVLALAKLAAWRDQLFAEALHLLAKGGEHARYWPTKTEEREILKPVQEAREIQDPWLEIVAVWIKCPEQRDRKTFTTAELLTHACQVHPDKIDGARSMATRVGIIMNKLGWVRRRDSDGDRLWRYHRPVAPDATGGPVHADADDLVGA